MTGLLLAIIYLAFISLGLPDCMLGAAWPVMYTQFGVPISYAGVISMIIAFGTIVSSLLSDRLTLKLGTGRVTAISVAITAAALLGFSLSSSFILLCILALPYGLGAGSVDASLNNYVALHYAGRHMSWLHCMWGVGAAAGPYVMSWALTYGKGWNAGYRCIGMIQIVLTLILFLSLPLWKGRAKEKDEAGSGEKEKKPMSLREVLSIKGAKEIMVCFFCYCALEQTALLWSASYFVLKIGVSTERAAGLAAVFALGITGGRAISGFLTIRLSDTQMIRLGQGLILVGILVLFLPAGSAGAVCGLILVGLGCAPIYPCIIHSTPVHFGAERSQAVIGVQMASAYIGTLAMPPIFGLVARHISAGLLPVYLFLILTAMVLLHERLLRVAEN